MRLAGERPGEDVNKLGGVGDVVQPELHGRDVIPDDEVPHVNALGLVVVDHIVRKVAAAWVVVVYDHRLQHLRKH